MSEDNFEKIMRKLKFQQVSDAIRKNPKSWVGKLEDLGFSWFDDDEDMEEAEENAAKSENLNQELVVAYFDGHVELSDQVLDSYLAEKDSPEPNYPLIRKYYKKGNANLKKLLLLGLEKMPTDVGLLSDLGFFHEYSTILDELIHLYLKACEEEQDMDKFRELVSDFYCNTVDDGFDALYELAQKFSPDSNKGMIVQKIVDELNSESDGIQF
jgi:hypothetical protein